MKEYSRIIKRAARKPRGKEKCEGVASRRSARHGRATEGTKREKEIRRLGAAVAGNTHGFDSLCVEITRCWWWLVGA
jgi:hypothetical protein